MGLGLVLTLKGFRWGWNLGGSLMRSHMGTLRRFGMLHCNKCEEAPGPIVVSDTLCPAVHVLKT